jgi:paraquat-inducible protein A
MSDTLRLRIAWALTLSGAILYFPANTIPVMTISLPGKIEPLTVMGGVMELYHSGLPPVAAIVFLASVAVPALKVLALLWLLSRHGSGLLVRRRIAVHAFLVRIGTWAMIDLFLLSILAAVGQLGVLAGVQAEPGALFFGAMILCVLYAAEVYKPHMVWQDLDTYERA